MQVLVEPLTNSVQIENKQIDVVVHSGPLRGRNRMRAGRMALFTATKQIFASPSAVSKRPAVHASVGDEMIRENN